MDKNNVKAKYKSYFLNFVGLKIFLWGDHCSTDSKDQYLNLSMHKGFNVSFGNFFDNNCDLQTIKANCTILSIKQNGRSISLKTMSTFTNVFEDDCPIKIILNWAGRVRSGKEKMQHIEKEILMHQALLHCSFAVNELLHSKTCLRPSLPT